MRMHGILLSKAAGQWQRALTKEKLSESCPNGLYQYYLQPMWFADIHFMLAYTLDYGTVIIFFVIVQLVQS